MPSFTPKELEILEKYVTNPRGTIFAVHGLSGIIGPAYARYSRARGSFLETFLKEFLKEGKLDALKAREVIERILVAYGDDSVGELEGGHVSFEEISVLATKEIQDRRIGGSPIEQSTRYVVYDQKDSEGRFRYARPAEIMRSKHAKAYEKLMDDLFSAYAALVEPMQEFFRARKPLDSAEYDIRGIGKKQKLSDLSGDKEIKAFKLTHKFDLRTKTCDTIRVLLPASVRTNVGMFGNGRFYQNLLTHLYSHELEEMRDIAKKAHAELNQIMPVFVKRAKPNEYVLQTKKRMKRIAGKLFAGVMPRRNSQSVLLLPREIEEVGRIGSSEGSKELMTRYEEVFEVNMIAQMLFPYLSHPISQIRDAVRALSPSKREEILLAYYGDRATRRDRPGRALEYGYDLTFELEADFGSYRDLERHRMLTQERQLLSPHIAFVVPEELKEAGFEENVCVLKERSAALYDEIAADLGREVAQYAALFGFHIRWIMGMNDREAMHLLELRTVPQGHPSYRDVCQKMHKEILKKRAKWRGEAMKFVDYNDYYWSRADSEARQRVKEKVLEEKYEEVGRVIYSTKERKTQTER
ncbi:MAG: hypothetical protein UX30_C0008G0003 [Candidatus Saccharibacteria bacterium GW2011_GWA2_46_10]|nr:MAG: hypothetical protein UX30_C0008G0003 [Candidatus Saccharibacteria bacterium GW2011_GWA2_46_10]